MSRSWKEKATERNMKIRALNKRIEELIESRNMWKEKAIEKENNIEELEEDLKKTLEEIMKEE